MLDLREQHAERAEQPRHRRHQNSADVEQARECRGMDRAIAAEGQHGQIARIASALGGDRA